MPLVPAPVRVSNYFLLVLILVVRVAGMFRKSKQKPRSTPATDPVMQGTSFPLMLPGHWTPGRSDDSARRPYNTTAEPLAVSIFGSSFGSPGTMDHDKKVDPFTRLVEIRRAAETKTPGFADVSLGTPMFAESGGVWAARYQDFDAARQRRSLLACCRVRLRF